MDKNTVKTFVIDTNVFIHKPDAIMSFRDSEVVIPLWVLEELDHLKTYSDERGRNARAAIRQLDELAKHGNLNEGVKMENGSILKIVMALPDVLPANLSTEKMDNKILLSAYVLKNEGKKVFFVSKDINARVKATVLGLKAVDYEKQKVNITTLYKGYREAVVSSDTITHLKVQGAIEWKEQCYHNESILFRDKENDTVTIGRFNAGTSTVTLTENTGGSVCGIKPLNDNQRIALDLLMDSSISLVTLVGKAGTGKTLLAIATGLKKVIEDHAYARVLVSRPIVPLGKDIGYLPGTKNEKLSHWMQPIFDNLEYILSSYKHQNMKNADQLLANRLIEIEALTYIRGRSLPNQFIIIDEAQNLSPHEVKTIVSRAGDGTKIVLTGDPYQIDSPYLDSSSNGLTYLVEIFKGQKIAGHITLEKSERSALAELAAELL
ncbi:MAG: PhoH family protein [Spirochaetales bacterium]|nr:MAG: PhoH family protein [Spirochaetales bacterium]